MKVTVEIQVQAAGGPFGEDDYDSMIVTMPSAFYVTVGGERTLLALQFSKWVRQVAGAMAYNLGRELHHAEVVITRDPHEIMDRGLMHDCDECRAGVDAALAVVEDDPEIEVVVGQLWWVPTGREVTPTEHV